MSLTGSFLYPARRNRAKTWCRPTDPHSTMRKPGPVLAECAQAAQHIQHFHRGLFAVPLWVGDGRQHPGHLVEKKNGPLPGGRLLLHEVFDQRAAAAFSNILPGRSSLSGNLMGPAAQPLSDANKFEFAVPVSSSR